jgi:DNA-directed RNA polymerase I, II, and III subunit RPABC2
MQSELLENDYRNILGQYDVMKNRTRPVITSYERSLLIGKRATQIAYGAQPLVEVKPGMNEIAIAESELEQRRLPFIIKRILGDHVEYWKPADMLLL